MTYWLLLSRTFHRVLRHDCLGLASQAAFGAVMSLVPAFICLIAVTSTFGLSDSTITLVVARLAGLLPAGSQPAVDAIVRAAVEHPAPGLLTTSLLVTLWSASGMLATYAKGLNRAYGVRPRYGYWRDRAIALVLVVVVAVPLAGASVAMLFARQVSRLLRAWLALGPAEAFVFGTGRWIATFLVVVFVVSLVYIIAPSHPAQPLDVLPGAVVATALWALASIGFNLFTVSRYAHYGTYGGLTAAVIFLFWVQISSTALLIGGELNAELESMRRATKTTPQRHEESKEDKDF